MGSSRCARRSLTGIAVSRALQAPHGNRQVVQNAPSCCACAERALSRTRVSRSREEQRRKLPTAHHSGAIRVYGGGVRSFSRSPRWLDCQASTRAGRTGRRPESWEQGTSDLQTQIAVHDRDSQSTCDNNRITADSRGPVVAVTVKTIVKPIANMGIAEISQRPFQVVTTIADHATEFPPNLVNRHFDQARLHAFCTSDNTHLEPARTRARSVMGTLGGCSPTPSKTTCPTTQSPPHSKPRGSRKRIAVRTRSCIRIVAGSSPRKVW